MSIVKLTQHIITNDLHCPDGKTRVELCDRELPGLYVEVRATNPGQGTYYLRYKDDTGKTCHQKVGRTTDIDLAEARKKAPSSSRPRSPSAPIHEGRRRRKRMCPPSTHSSTTSICHTSSHGNGHGSVTKGCTTHGSRRHSVTDV
jgi:hypothetical protein